MVSPLCTCLDPWWAGGLPVAWTTAIPSMISHLLWWQWSTIIGDIWLQCRSSFTPTILFYCCFSPPPSILLTFLFTPYCPFSPSLILFPSPSVHPSRSFLLLTLTLSSAPSLAPLQSLLSYPFTPSLLFPFSPAHYLLHASYLLP